VQAIPGERPYPGRIPIPWTVGGILLWGWGKKPPPLSLLSICQHPPPQEGVVQAIPGERPYPGRIPIPWTVGGILLWGWGKKPPPPSLLSICRYPPPREGVVQAIPGAYPYTLDRGRHTPVGVGQKTPSPVSTFNMPASLLSPGRGSAGDTRGKAVPGRINPRASSFFRFSPYAGPWGISPRGWG
jgi:hypothetical protein